MGNEKALNLKPQFITDAVILSKEDYEALLQEIASLKETLFLLENPSNAQRLYESIAQAKAGQAQERQIIEP